MAETKSKEVLGAIIALFIGAIFAGYILPPAITAIFNADTSLWDAGTATLWLVLGIVVVISVVVIFLRTTGLI